MVLSPVDTFKQQHVKLLSTFSSLPVCPACGMAPPIEKKNNITFDQLQQLSILDALARVLFVFLEFTGMQIHF